MRMLRNFSYAVDAFLCRHGDQISKVFCLAGGLFFGAVIFDSLFLAVLLFNELLAAETLFAGIFIGLWFITCAVIAPIACAIIAYKCYKASQRYGWRNLAY